MSAILAIFLIAAVGYIIGSIAIKGVSLGTSAVLLVALVYGHFSNSYPDILPMVPSIVKNIGLALFVCSVGLMSGPVFFRNFKSKVFAYLVLGILVIAIGVGSTILVGDVFGTNKFLSLGMMSGALTSTPALAAATESAAAAASAEAIAAGSSAAVAARVGASASDFVSVGYGIAYVFGVIGVVLFVQLYPRIVKCNVPAEVEALRLRLHGNTIKAGADGEQIVEMEEKKLKVLEPSGSMIFCIVITIGMLLGSIKIGNFSLGISGGPLFAGIIIGHFRRIGNIDIRVPAKTLSVLRELGLMLFLVGAGTDAGTGFVAVLKEYGGVLFLQGALITLLPMLIGCIVARFIFKLDVLSMLGCICGGMTSTPALGSLISSAKTEDVAVSYAATYPFALICVVIAAQLLGTLW